MEKIHWIITISDTLEHYKDSASGALFCFLFHAYARLILFTTFQKAVIGFSPAKYGWNTNDGTKTFSPGLSTHSVLTSRLLNAFHRSENEARRMWVLRPFLNICANGQLYRTSIRGSQNRPRTIWRDEKYQQFSLRCFFALRLLFCTADFVQSHPLVLSTLVKVSITKRTQKWLPFLSINLVILLWHNPI